MQEVRNMKISKRAERRGRAEEDKNRGPLKAMQRCEQRTERDNNSGERLRYSDGAKNVVKVYLLCIS